MLTVKQLRHLFIQPIRIILQLLQTQQFLCNSHILFTQLVSDVLLIVARRDTASLALFIPNIVVQNATMYTF